MRRHAGQPPRPGRRDGGEPHVYMLLDPVTREAYRPPEPTGRPAPAFFTSVERAEAYARAHGLAGYRVYPVPAGVLARMKGKPHWLDGERQE